MDVLSWEGAARRALSEAFDVVLVPEPKGGQSSLLRLLDRKTGEVAADIEPVPGSRWAVARLRATTYAAMVAALLGAAGCTCSWDIAHPTVCHFSFPPEPASARDQRASAPAPEYPPIFLANHAFSPLPSIEAAARSYGKSPSPAALERLHAALIHALPVAGDMSLFPETRIAGLFADEENDTTRAWINRAAEMGRNGELEIPAPPDERLAIYARYLKGYAAIVQLSLAEVRRGATPPPTVDYYRMATEMFRLDRTQRAALERQPFGETTIAAFDFALALAEAHHRPKGQALTVEDEAHLYAKLGALEASGGASPDQVVVLRALFRLWRHDNSPTLSAPWSQVASSPRFEGSPETALSVALIDTARLHVNAANSGSLDATTVSTAPALAYVFSELDSK